jgi:hypothetical protein
MTEEAYRAGLPTRCSECGELLPHPIPRVTDPRGQWWEQPDRSEIEVDETHALMSRETFSKLSEDDHSISATFAGKMWKSWYKADRWWLYWFGETSPGKNIFVERREILVI